MTKAEKWKDELGKKVINSIWDIMCFTDEEMEEIYNRFEKTTKPKPTLTEDEKVVLRNIKPQPTHITRDFDGDLELRYEESESIRYDVLPEFNHLFQFIKERRRI